jgi:hypothetical protein
MSDKQHPALAIQLNNAATNDPCAICGARTDPECGPELFIAGTVALVCYECGRKHGPELVDMLWEHRQRLLEANEQSAELAYAVQAGHLRQRIFKGEVTHER